MSERDRGRGAEASAVTAVVVAFDSADVLPACLDTLASNGVAALVVDNGSRDGSADLAERHGAAVIRQGRNEGYGRANTIGVAAATTPWVLIVNPDVTLDEGAASSLLVATRRYPDAGMWAPRLVEPSGRVFFQPRSLLAPFLPNPRGVRTIPAGDVCAPFLSGACFLMERRVFLELGGFDPAIFLFYEDDDLCRRVADSGRALVHVHDAVARHGRGRSSAPAPGRVFRARWHAAWSRAYISAKWGLEPPGFGPVLVNGVKALGAALLGRRRLVERYAGSAAGAWAFRVGRTALMREGLNPEPPAPPPPEPPDVRR